VADLLADTGLGRAGYAIVGQSEIDQALAAKPEQRRAWIDEAAGVQRYRVRRNDAQRRLGNARLQLERVDDVLSEIERERGPLEEEARTARIHRELTLRLRSLEADLLVRDLHDATTERSRLDDARQNAERARGEAAEHIIRAQAALEALGLDLDRLEQDRHRLSEELAQQRSAAEQARAASAIAQGKRESLLQLAESLDGEEGHLRAESEAAEAEWQASVTQETEAKARLADLRADLELVDAEAVRKPKPNSRPPRRWWPPATAPKPNALPAANACAALTRNWTAFASRCLTSTRAWPKPSAWGKSKPNCWPRLTRDGLRFRRRCSNNRPTNRPTTKRSAP
jgi:chromosome segregation protein